MRVDADHASANLKNAATETKDYVQEKADSLNLSTTNIKDEMSHLGAVIRRKTTAAGHAIADAASDTKITTTIKGKLVADPNLSALSISVSTTDGLVTMSGTASSPRIFRRPFNWPGTPTASTASYQRCRSSSDEPAALPQ